MSPTNHPHRIGIVGGGQLAKMLGLAGARMGFEINVVDLNADCPAASVATHVIAEDMQKQTAVEQLARISDIVTLDTEHVPAAFLAAVAKNVIVRPGHQVLSTIQDRLTQKEFLKKNGLPCADFRAVTTADDLSHALSALGPSLVVKTREGGYDGRGQRWLHAPVSEAEQQAIIGAFQGAPCIAEQRVAFVKEVSVMIARRPGGETSSWPLIENVHVNGILHTSRFPAAVTDEVHRRARALAVAVVNALEGVGVFGVEMFLMADGKLLVNEVAPRTHNSGHVTFGASTTSQFEQHLRAICDLPLGRSDALCSAVMLNLLGDLWHVQGTARAPNWHLVHAMANAKLHLYGKADARLGRKMGHVLFLGDDTDTLMRDALALHDALSTGW